MIMDHKSMQQKVIIIIPTYNEALNIENTIKNIFDNTAQVNDFLIDVLVFDSASKDNTVEIVKSLMRENKRICLVEEAQKSGLGSAYWQAMRYAMNELQADIVFEYDADGSHNPIYIAPMLECIRAGADVVVGSRYVKGGSIPSEWGWHRKVLSGLGNVLARCLLFRQYHDYTSGFRASKSKFLKIICQQPFLSTGYAYKFQVFCQLHQLSAVIKEHPIKFVDREKGVSKLPKNSIADSLQVLFKLRVQMVKRILKWC